MTTIKINEQIAFLRKQKLKEPTEGQRKSLTTLIANV